MQKESDSTQKRKRCFLKISAILIVVLLLGSWLGVYMYTRHVGEKIVKLRQQQAEYDATRQRVLAWLEGTQLENGAFVFYPSSSGEYSVNPYYACYTVLALLKSSGADRANQVKKYFDWHFDHLNSSLEDPSGLNGTIFDYKIIREDSGVLSEQTTYEYDSTDSYAALFLMALNVYVEATGDIDYLLGYSEEVLSVIAVMEFTTKNGLSTASPDYPVIYLMDNAEVICGNKAAIHLLKNMSKADPKFAIESQNVLEATQERLIKMDKALEKDMFLIDQGIYAPSVRWENSMLVYADFDWETFYPDAVAQLFPIIMEIIPPDSRRAEMLYYEFCSYWEWEQLQHQSQGSTPFYWSAIAYCAALMDDTQRVDSYIDLLNQDALVDFAYPVYNADMAWLILTCNERISQLETEITRLDPFGWIEATVQHV